MTSRLSILFTFALALWTPSFGEELSLSASDLLADFIREPLESYAADNDIDLELESIGTLPAMDRLGEKETDLAIIAVPSGQEPPSGPYSSIPFAYGAAVVVVHKSNLLNEISMVRLGGIFGENQEENFSTWGDLGLSGWNNRLIKPLAGQKEGSISLELFKNEVFRGGGMKNGVSIVENDEVEGMVEMDPIAIAILPGLPKSPQLKTLMVSPGKEGTAFGPSEDNVHFGDYPIRLSFYVIYESSNHLKVRPILKSLFSEEAAEALRSNDLFPIPNTVRRKQLIDIELER